MTDARPVPRLLPPDVTHFTDRKAELGILDSLLSADPAGPSAAVVTAIAGTAGMGKTSLAVRWAHRVCDQFPDGQLYANLRGYDPGPPVTPEKALDGFLRALDVPGESIPRGLDAMAGFYRSMLTGRRMLVVLDSHVPRRSATPAAGARTAAPSSAVASGLLSARSAPMTPRRRITASS